MNDATADRRQLPRISFKAFGMNHLSRLYQGKSEHEVLLIDVNSEGARVKFRDLPQELDTGQEYLFNIRIEPLGVETGEVQCMIRWTWRDEAGLAFNRTLDMSVTDLQHRLGS